MTNAPQTRDPAADQPRTATGRTDRSPRGAWSAVLAGAILSVALAALLLLVPEAGLPIAALAAVVGGLLVASATPASVFLSAALCLQVFAGNWHLLGLPIGLDRLLLVAALAALGRDLSRRRGAPALRLRAVHVALAAMTAVATLSALLAGTLLTSLGFFALLDRLGVVPFVAFAIAPLVYRRRRDRDVLLAALVVTGAYLGVTAFAEGLGVDQLVFPRYILNEDLGIHAGRARGPFLEAVAMGFGLYACTVASAVAAATWQRPATRRLALVVGALCLVGTVFTLTRAVWLATLVATVVAAAGVPQLRRLLLPSALVGTLVLLAALTLVPGLADQVGERSTDQRPLWDRYNTNNAAVQIVLDKPLTGVGWQRFATDGPQYMRQSEDYPLTGAGIEVHNVPLGHAAELGLPTAFLFLVCLALGVGHAVLRKPSAELAPWRAALVALALAWAVIASFGPLSYSFHNTLLWLWSGVVLAPFLRGDDGQSAEVP